MVVAGGNHQMREHVLQEADIEGMMGAMIATGMMVVVAVAMAVNLCLESEPFGIAAVMVMVGHNGMEHDNRTCKHDHDFCHQMFHLFHFTSSRKLAFQKPLTLQR